jgi:hypothetical protein
MEQGCSSAVVEEYDMFFQGWITDKSYCMRLCLALSMSSCMAGCGSESGNFGVESFAPTTAHMFMKTQTTNVPWIEGQVYGGWLDLFSGYGTIEALEATASQTLISLWPAASATPSETHSALVTSTASFGDFDAGVIVTTLAQLRTPMANPWEVGWVLWHYTDNTHFYYITLKPSGWELGKEDPAYPGDQRYLATGSSPTFPVGAPYNVRITQSKNAMTVWVNGRVLTSFTDTQRPYTSGKLGLYCEDSHVTYGEATVNKVLISA